MGRVGPQFWGRARAGPRLRQAARAFYSVKELKTSFRIRIGPKKIFRGLKISAHARPVKFMGGLDRGWASGPGRARLKMLRGMEQLWSSLLALPIHMGKQCP
jgi:hypothetical protein